jgi:putative MATE family efflux protein
VIKVNQKTKSAQDSLSNFTEGSILKKLLFFMLPVFGALVLQAMYGAVDLLVVGRFGSTEGLSGVSTGSQILNLVTFVVTALSTGLTVQIGHYLGEKRPEKIGRLIGSGIMVFLVIAAVLCVVMAVFARPIAVVMQAPQEAVDETITYIRICGAGIFCIVAYNVIAAIFRGIGDSKTPLIFVAVACVVNVVGDLIFVAVFKWNVAGAAFATVLAQGVSVVLSLIIMKKKDLPFQMKRGDVGFNSEAKKFLRIGFPLALQEFLTQISFSILCAFVNAVGLEASSGYGVASKVISFIMLIPSALMQSMAAFVSQNVSAGKEKRSQQSMVTGMVFGACVGLAVVALIWTCGGSIASIFTNDPLVVQNAWAYLKGFSPEAFLTAFLFSYYGFFNGHDRTMFVMIAGIIQTFCVRLPFAYFQSTRVNPSLTRIGAAAPLATCTGIVLCTVYYIWYIRGLKRKTAE